MSTKYIAIIILAGGLLVSAYFFLGFNNQPAEKNQAAINSRLPSDNQQNQQPPKDVKQSNFAGVEGQAASLQNDQILLDQGVFDDGLAHFYNTELADGKTVYFFVLKDKKGVYRAAANACQVCHDSQMGFRQQGDYMVCQTCGNVYPLEKIATEKGGCNPGPINPDLQVETGKVVIRKSDIEEISNLF